MSNYQRSIMNILLLEDEKRTAEHLIRLVQEIDPKIKILGPLASLREAREWFRNPPYLIDLLFLDIMLADGTSFELFEQFTIQTPVIFITAYDEYALQAFKVNSVDYLLKPIDIDDLKAAMKKFSHMRRAMGNQDHSWLKNLFQSPGSSYKKRFLIKSGDQLRYILVDEIAYFEFDEGLVFAHLVSGDRVIIDQSLDELQEVLDPCEFFRINRKIMVHLRSIKRIHPYFNRRLSVYLEPDQKNVVVSRERVQGFKDWLDQ